MNKYKYIISSKNYIIPFFECCPICKEEIEVTIIFKEWKFSFYCSKCGCEGNVNYVKMDNWKPEVMGEKINKF